MGDEETYTAGLSRDIDAAYAAYTPDNPESVEALYKALRAQASNIVWFHLGVDTPPMLVNDIVHRAILRLESFQGGSKISTWFCSLARNEVNRALRVLIQGRKRFVPIKGERILGEDREDDLADQPAKPVNQDAVIEVEQVRKNLPDEQDEVVRLVLEGHSLEEIAQKLDVPLGTIRGRYRLAKQKMAQRARKKRA